MVNNKSYGLAYLRALAQSICPRAAAGKKAVIDDFVLMLIVVVALLLLMLGLYAVWKSKSTEGVGVIKSMLQ